MAHSVKCHATRTGWTEPFSVAVTGNLMSDFCDHSSPQKPSLTWGWPWVTQLGCARGWAKPSVLLSALGPLKYRFYQWKIVSEMAQLRIQIWDKGRWWKADVVEKEISITFFPLSFPVCSFPAGSWCGGFLCCSCLTCSWSEDAPPGGRMCF